MAMPVGDNSGGGFREGEMVDNGLLGDAPEDAVLGYMFTLLCRAGDITLAGDDILLCMVGGMKVL